MNKHHLPPKPKNSTQQSLLVEKHNQYILLDVDFGGVPQMESACGMIPKRSSRRHWEQVDIRRFCYHRWIQLHQGLEELAINAILSLDKIVCETPESRDA